MWVRAKQLGWYNNRRQRPAADGRPADVFELKPYKKKKFKPNGDPVVDEKTGKQVVELITPEMQFSPRWMEKADAPPTSDVIDELAITDEELETKVQAPAKRKPVGRGAEVI